jgi:endonuclease YncB( thermonuclease family)
MGPRRAVVPPQSRFSLAAVMAARPRAPKTFLQPLFGLLAAVCVLSLAGASRADAVRCGTQSVGAGLVRNVTDGRTFVLADDREIRLAGIEVPPLSGVEDAGTLAAGRAARAALAALVVGESLSLKSSAPKTGGAETDRYGRFLVHATLVRDGAERSVAGELLAQGFARVAARVGSRECAAALLALERSARNAKLGLWAEPYYVMRQAEKSAEILAERGRFTLVEGKVLSVRESGGTIYVNFGRRWSEDFTVTIPRRSERAFSDAGLAPRQLSGRSVRVRGWIEERGGPWIEVLHPEQIEIADRN